MKLAFYSGGSCSDNMAIDREVFQLSGKKKVKITYIPSSSYDHDEDFVDFCYQHRKFGITRIINFPVDIPVDKVMEKYAFDSDIIHLSGGNTFYFLYYLRKGRYLNKLRGFVNQGGVLTGLSAGAILMTPNINTAGFPTFDRDENSLGINKFNALNLVDFEFFPHYINSRRYDNALLAYSKTCKRSVYACANGAGLLINGAMKSFYGKVYCFNKGRKILL